MAAELAARVAAFDRLSEESHADVVNGLRRSLKRWWRFLSTGVMPPASDFDPLRAWARDRASEGIRLEDLLWSFGLAHQLGWQLLRRHARSDESEVLIELAGLLAQYGSDRSRIRSVRAVRADPLVVESGPENPINLTAAPPPAIPW
jgi:hypothetical protein